MAGDYFQYFLVVLFVKERQTTLLHLIMPDDNKNFTMRSHLRFESVFIFCLNRDKACKSNNTNVCGLKIVKQKRFYKDFKNSCYLFMSNMCDHPDEEFFIARSGSCEQFLTERRSNEEEEEPLAVTDNEVGNNTDSTPYADTNNYTFTDAPALRQNSFSSLYDIDTSFDYHVCPHSCPKVYSPVCINVNRGFGKYFKILNFINHCSADVYYCKNWQEFAPPPHEDEMVRMSPLDWSFCGAARYLQFARFAEVASSIGHHGWLSGSYKYSHIMEPHERKPGYG